MAGNKYIEEEESIKQDLIELDKQRESIRKQIRERERDLNSYYERLYKSAFIDEYVIFLITDYINMEYNQNYVPVVCVCHKPSDWSKVYDQRSNKVALVNKWVIEGLVGNKNIDYRHYLESKEQPIMIFTSYKGYCPTEDAGIDWFERYYEYPEDRRETTKIGFLQLLKLIDMHHRGPNFYDSDDVLAEVSFKKDSKVLDFLMKIFDKQFERNGEPLSADELDEIYRDYVVETLGSESKLMYRPKKSDSAIK